MRLKLRLSHKGIILVAIPLVVELGLLAYMFVLLRAAEDESRKATHYQAVSAEMNSMLTYFHDAATTFVLFRIKSNPADFDRFRQLVLLIKERFHALHTLVGKDSMQQSLLDRIEPGVYRTIDGLARVTHYQGDALLWENHAPNDLERTLERLEVDLEQLIDYQTRVLKVNPADEIRNRSMMEQVLFGGVILNVLLALWLAAFVTQGMTRRLRALTANAERFAAGEPMLENKQGGNDEIANLDDAFHSMANALAEATAKERAIIDNALDVILSIDAQGKLTKINAASLSALGYAPAELQGKDYSSLIDPQDLEQAQERIKRAIEGKAEPPFECRMRPKSAASVSMLWSVQWVESTQSLICVLHDISERKMAEDMLRNNEARIRAIVDKMLVGLLIVTDDGAIELANPRMEELLGYKREDLVGVRLQKIFPDAEEFRSTKVLSGLKFLAQGKVLELTAAGRDGTSLPIELTVSEFDAVEGHRFLLNLLDISERYEVERLKKEFVTMVSHDLRSPLLTVNDALKTLSVGSCGELEDKGYKTISDAEREIGRLIKLTDDLLDVTRMDDGKLEVQLEPIDLLSIIQRSVAAVRGLAKPRNIEIETSVSDVEVLGHGDRLVQVLVNLLSNAIKFSPDNSVISIQTKKLDKNLVEVRVKDRGRGIPPQMIRSIFEKFEQVKSSDATKKGGAGLGLAICRSIIEAHSGEIGVDIEEGHGSTFWFRIAMTKSADANSTREL